MTPSPPTVPKPAHANFEGVALTVVENQQDATDFFLKLGNPRSGRDAMIAATVVIEHGFRVVTRNVSDFANAGVTFLNPWDT